MGEQTTCAYKSTPAEASLLQHAPAGCEGLSRTVPSRCPAGVKGTSTGVEINTQLMCVYDPQCAEPGADPAAHCYEQTTCAYAQKGSITTELLAAEVVNTTTAGFTTGGLAETQDLQQQQKSSGNRCCGQAPGGVPGSCGAPDWCSNPLDAWCSQSQDRCEKHCNGVFCPGVGAVEAALAAEEITTELLAAEVVNTTAAGFTTGGLAEAQDLPCGSDNSDDCVSEFHHGLGPFCSRCSNEGGNNPLRNRCHLCCTEC